MAIIGHPLFWTIVILGMMAYSMHFGLTTEPIITLVRGY